MRFTQWVAIYGPTYLTGLGWTAFIALWASVGAIVWGSALLLIRLALRLEERLGRPIQPLDLFRFPSVATLARFLSAGEEETPQAAALSAASEERHQARDRRRALRLVSGRGLGDTRGVGPA